MQSTLDFLRQNLLSINNHINSLKFPNQKLLYLQSNLKFVKLFPHQGAQSITGIVKIKDVDLVFKISLKFDNILQLEKTILESINESRKSCPHFMGYIGILTVPLSKEFLNDPEKHNIYSLSKEEMFPKDIAFYEYIHNISLYNICKNNELNLIISQLLQILLSLQSQQQKISFTHYDLHTDNVLIKECDPNSIFLYVLNGKKFAIPTFGFYPVLVDLASSYCDVLLNKPMYSSIHYYDQGLQPSCFDRLEDVHHLCMGVSSSCEKYAKRYCIPKSHSNSHSKSSSDSSIESKSESSSESKSNPLSEHNDDIQMNNKLDATLYFANKLRFLFRHLPISNKGWKSLKYDFLNEAIQNIEKKCNNYDRFQVIEDYEEHIISMLCTLIILPFKKYKEPIKIEKFYNPLLEDISKLFMFLDVDSEDHGLYILHNLFTSIHNILEKNLDINTEIKAFLTNISGVFPSLRSYIPKMYSNNLIVMDKSHTRLVIKFEEIINNAKMVSFYLSDLFCGLLKEHSDIIEKCYDKTVIKNPYDMFLYLSQNFTPNFEINNKSTIYIWDMDNNTSSIKNLGEIGEINYELLNRTSFLGKGDLIYSLVSDKIENEKVEEVEEMKSDIT